MPDYVSVYQWRHPEPEAPAFNVQVVRANATISSHDFHSLEMARDFAKSFGLEILEDLKK